MICLILNIYSIAKYSIFEIFNIRYHKHIIDVSREKNLNFKIKLVKLFASYINY